MAKYNTYHSDNKVIVVSRYAGKAVRGIAKCAPGDLFNGVFGESLAKARCDEKVSEKRLKRAEQLYAEAVTAYAAAQNRMQRMAEYLDEAAVEYEAATKAVAALEAEANK